MKKTSQKRAILTLLLSILIFSAPVFAAEYTRADGVFVDTVLNRNIHTVQLRQAGVEISYPVITFGSENMLSLSFDVLGDNVENYQYAIERCNRHWQQTTLMPHQYMQGQNFGFIENYQNSYNTFIRYTHYRIEFPTKDINIKLSGNYIIKVYRNYDPDDVVIVRRFYLAEQQAGISGNLRAAMNPALRHKAQQLDMTINLANLDVPNIYTDIYVVVKQNNRDYNAVAGLQPQYVRGRELIYEQMNELVFLGMNEFRPLDLRSVRVPGNGVARLKLDSFYRAQVYQDIVRGIHSYTFIRDLNGQRIVSAENVANSHTEADYVQTHFSFDSPVQTPLYLFGEITNWKISPEYRLMPNQSSGVFESTLNLKQGYINYWYVTVVNGQITPLPFEGSFFETENDYLVFVYYRSPELNGDLLVGYRRFNSTIR